VIQRYTVSYELLGSVDEIGADPDGFGLGSDNGSGEGPSTVPSVTIQIFGQSLANDPDPTRVTVPLRNESVVIVGLEEFHVYRFVIFYENSQGRSNSSAPVVAQTFVSGKNKFALFNIKSHFSPCTLLLAVPNGPPTNVSAIPLTSSSINITWGPPLAHERNGQIVGYDIVVSKASGNRYFYNISGTDFSFFLDGTL
jgi:hypothetical protein